MLLGGPHNCTSTTSSGRRSPRSNHKTNRSHIATLCHCGVGTRSQLIGNLGALKSYFVQISESQIEREKSATEHTLTADATHGYRKCIQPARVRNLDWSTQRGEVSLVRLLHERAIVLLRQAHLSEAYRCKWAGIGAIASGTELVFPLLLLFHRSRRATIARGEFRSSSGEFPGQEGWLRCALRCSGVVFLLVFFEIAVSVPHLLLTDESALYNNSRRQREKERQEVEE